MTTSTWVALALVAALGGCGDDGDDQAVIDAPPVDAPAPDADSRTTVLETPATPLRALDLLLMVDDSTSTQDKQQNFIANFPAFVNVLDTLPGGRPDLHIAVATSDMGVTASGSTTLGPSLPSCTGHGKDGVFQLGTATGSDLTGKFLSDIADGTGMRMKNYTGNLSDVVGKLASVGSQGCGFEQPLAGMKAALSNTTENGGFLRPDALLGVVFLTDEDDCSAKSSELFAPDNPALGARQSFRCTRFGVTCDDGGTTTNEMNTVGTKTMCHSNEASQYLDPVAPYAAFLKSLKTDPRLVVVANIAGPTAPFAVELRSPPGSATPIPALAHSCTSEPTPGSPQVADPAVRMVEFADHFPNRSTFTSVCQSSLTDGLSLIAQLLKTTLGSSCLEAQIADVDPNTPGSQPDCIVEDVLGSTVTAIPACGTVQQDLCWSLVEDVATCQSAEHLRLDVHRTTAAPAGTTTHMRCVTP